MKIFKERSFFITLLLPILFILIAVETLCTTEYVMFSKGKYAEHELITFDYDHVADRIMGYLNYKYDEMELEYPDYLVEVKELEERHMKDVLNIFTAIRIVGVISYILVTLNLFFLVRNNKKKIFESLKWLFIWPTALILFVGIFAVIDFDLLFTLFHKLFFNNDDWLFPMESMIIQVVPLNFWLMCVVIILSFLALMLVACNVLGNYKLKKYLK